MSDKLHNETVNHDPATEHTKDLEALNMILRRYNTMIFEPERKELEPPVMSEIDKLMKKTKHIRPTSYTVKHIFNMKILAFAASFLVACVLAFQLYNIQSSSNSEGVSKDFIPTKMRGGSNGAVAVPSDKKNEQPLAYLVDIAGEIKITTRGGKSPASCEVLFNNDIVMLSAGASAKIMYSDAIFNIAGPQKYQVLSPSPAIVQSAQVRGKAIDPVLTTRGNHLGTNNTPSIVMPPKTLMASIIAPITRAGDSINVYSPKGASYTDKPIIKIGGDPQQKYIVSILDMEGTVIGKPITIAGCTQKDWKDFSAPPIVEDEIYTLRVQLNGKIVNDTNNASFWLLSSEEKEKVSVALKYVSSIKSLQEKQFFQANAFYMNGCYAESFLILENASTTENNLMKQLLKLCKISLKIQEK